MQSYDQSPANYDQPLDFTSKHHRASTPILDLSCKKSRKDDYDQMSNSCSSSPGRSLSPSDETNTSINENLMYQSQHISCGDGRKSPAEARAFMVTPPSESDSPKRLKYYPIYPQLPLESSEPSPIYPTLPPEISNQPISSILSNVLTGDNLSQYQVSTSFPTVVSNSQHENSVSTPFISSEASKKLPRPFKAYPKDPLSMSMISPELIHDPRSTEAYNEFRKQMLESVRKTNKGTNIKMRRISKSPTLPTSTFDDKDQAYWERRRKNNEAAKRSRDARRAKEDEIAIRAAFLERENMQLKCEILALRNETAKLRCMVYSN